MKKLILHIGQSKTGTTSIQAFLQKNRKALADKGIIYPDYFIKGLPLNTPEHNAFAEQLAGLERYPRLSIDEYFHQFEQQMEQKGCHTLLLSGERFFGVPQIWRTKNRDNFFEEHKRKLLVLKKLTEKYETHVIGYFRPPEEWLETVVAHTIRYEGLSKNSTYIDDKQFFSDIQPHMKYDQLLGLWEEVLTPKTMTILPYQKDILLNGDAVQDFTRRLNIPENGLEFLPDAFEHRSLDKRYVNLKKELNRAQRSKTKERITIICLDTLNNKLPKIQKYTIDDLGLRKEIESFCQPIHEWMKKYSEGNTSFFSHTFKISGDIEPETSTLEQDQHDFIQLYKSPAMRFVYAKTRTKSFLRKKFLIGYTFIKNLRALAKIS